MGPIRRPRRRRLRRTIRGARGWTASARRTIVVCRRCSGSAIASRALNGGGAGAPRERSSLGRGEVDEDDDGGVAHRRVLAREGESAGFRIGTEGGDIVGALVA